MAPKRPAAKPTKGESKAKKSPSRDVEDGAVVKTGGGEETDTLARPPKNKEEVLQRVSFSGLPVAGDTEDAIVQLLNIKYETLAQVFAHYSKATACKTVKIATQLHLGTRVAIGPSARVLKQSVAIGRETLTPSHPLHAKATPKCVCRSAASVYGLLSICVVVRLHCCMAVGFKKLVKDTGLESKVYNIDQMTKLLNLTAGLKVIGRTARLRPRSLSLMVHRSQACTLQMTWHLKYCGLAYASRIASERRPKYQARLDGLPVDGMGMHWPSCPHAARVSSCCPPPHTNPTGHPRHPPSGLADVCLISGRRSGLVGYG